LEIRQPADAARCKSVADAQLERAVIASRSPGVHARAMVPVDNSGLGAEMDVRRWLPLSGVVFVVLALVAVIGLGGDTPESNAPGSEVLSFYDDNEVRQAIGAFVFVASLPFLVAFAACLVSATRSAGRQAVWEYLLVGGSFVTAAVLAIISAVIFAKTDGATNDASPEALQALNLIDGNGWVAFNGGLGIMMLGAAGSLLALAGSYRWLGRTALVLGIALFIPFADFVALVLTLIWIIVASIVLFRDAEPATQVVVTSTG
jgi:hypothetical protein